MEEALQYLLRMSGPPRPAAPPPPPPVQAGASEGSGVIRVKRNAPETPATETAAEDYAI